VYVPEKHLQQLRPGQVARINAPSLGGEGYIGSIMRISPVVDPRSGTVKVTVALGWQPGLRPGLYVDVDLVTAVHQDALLVPKRALVYDNDRMFVFRLQNDEETKERRAERVMIEPVLTDKAFIEPLEGLEPGDQVIIAGQAGLKDGVLVSLPGDEVEDDEDQAGDQEEPVDDQGSERASL
jgi:membrane fusion protein (multidrug efflux system)